MKTLTNQKTKKRIRFTIKLLSIIIAFVSFILFIIGTYNLFFNIFAKEPELLIICKNDDEDLYHWNGISFTDHNFCSKCGENIEDVGIIIPKQCLNCTSHIDQEDEFCFSCGEKIKSVKLREWLTEKNCQTLKEYKENFQNIMIKHIVILIILFVIWILIVEFYPTVDEILQDWVQGDEEQN